MEKTCGNCESWRTVGIERGYCIFDNSLEDGCVKLHLRDDAACNKHTDVPLTLEQRYKQLAEVARDLFRRTLVAYGGEDVSIIEIDCFRERLEELGMEL